MSNGYASARGQTQPASPVHRRIWITSQVREKIKGSAENAARSPKFGRPRSTSVQEAAATARKVNPTNASSIAMLPKLEKNFELRQRRQFAALDHAVPNQTGNTKLPPTPEPHQATPPPPHARFGVVASTDGSWRGRATRFQSELGPSWRLGLVAAGLRLL